MSEYRVKVGIRNNLILAAIEEMGFSSVAAFCRQYGLRVNTVNALICMRTAPITTEGSFCAAAKELMEALGATPSDLWTDRQLTMCLERNTSERVVSESVVIQYLLDDYMEKMLLPSPEDVLGDLERDQVVRDMLKTLRPNEERVLKMRHGIGCDDMTLDECGEVIGVTRERVRQIELKAERKLRHPVRSLILREARGEGNKLLEKSCRNQKDAIEVREIMRDIAKERESI